MSRREHRQRTRHGWGVHGAGRAARALSLVMLIATIGIACGRGPAELDGRVVVVNAVSRDLILFQGPSLERDERIALPGVAHGLSIEPGTARAWVALRDRNSVSVVDLDTGEILQTVRVCRDPIDVAFSTDLHRAYVACEDGYMNTIDTRTLTRMAGRAAIGFAPRTMLAGPRGHLWAANRGSNDLSEIDPAERTLLERYPAAPFAYGLAFSPDQRYAYVTSHGWNAVAVLDTEDMQILGSIEVGEEPSAVVANAERIYVASRGAGTVTVINARTFQDIATIPEVGRDPESLALSPDGRLLFVAAHGSGQLTVIDTHALEVTLRLRAGEGPVGVEVVT